MPINIAKISYKHLFLIGLTTASFSFATPKPKPQADLEVQVTPSTIEELEQNKPSWVTKQQAQALKDMYFMDNIKNLDLQDQMIVKQQALGTPGKRLMQQLKGFAPEALVFYTAIGATMVRKAYTDQLISGRRDPLWLENLSHEISSPLGVFSFFCFLIASGQSNYWLSQILKPWSKKLSQQLQAQKINKIRYKREKKLARKNHLPPPKQKSSFYKVSRIGFQQSAGLINQAGLAVGIIASNIVTELGMLMTNPAVHYCARHLLPQQFSDDKQKLSPQNAELICNDAFETSMSTFKSWGPEILSVILASIINHGLTQGLFTLKKGARASFHLLKNVTVKANSTASIKKLIGTMAWLTPGIGQMGKVVSVAGHWTFRLFNLYSFMEIAEFTGHYLFHGWHESQKANDLKDSLINATYHLNPQSQKQGLNCQQASSQEDCSYHPSIQTALSASNHFIRWRGLQSMPIDMVQYSWLNYVSRTLSYFDTTYQLYKSFIMSKHTNSHFNQTYYLGSLLAHTQQNKLMTEPLQKDLPQPVQDIFQTMMSKIKRHIENPTNTPHDIPYFVTSIFSTPKVPSLAQIEIPTLKLTASISDTHFAKPNIQLHRVSKPFDVGTQWLKSHPKAHPIELYETHTQLKSLYELFSVAQDHAPLFLFYDDFKSEIEKAKNKVFTTDAHQLRSVCNQAFKTVKTIQELKVEHPQDFNNLPSELSNIIESQTQTFKHCANIKSKNFTTYNETKQHIDIETLLTQSKTTQQFFTKSTAERLVEHYYNLHPDKWTKKARNLLKKKVLAAGTDLLTQIVNKNLQSVNTFVKTTQLSDAEQQAIEQLKNQGYPKDLTQVLTQLGPHNIFASLFKELYRADKTGSYVAHIKPTARGMSVVKKVNNYFKTQEEYDETSYHPKKLARFHTPGMMDFLIASSLCGPDLFNDVNHSKMIDKIKHITSGESTIEEVFPNQNMDEITEQLPIFKRSLTGLPFYLLPPQLPKSAKTHYDIKKLCENVTLTKVIQQTTGVEITKVTHNDIYNSQFNIKGKHYSSLLEVALDYVPVKNFSNVSEFDLWWNNQVAPYRDLFTMLADREYNKLIITTFMPLLFQNERTDVDHSLNFKQTQVLNNTIDTVFSKSHQEGLFKEKPDTSFTRRFPQTKYQFYFSKGIIQSIHQEMRYWADIVIALSKQTSSPDTQYQVKEDLNHFVNLFKVPVEYWETKESDSLYQSMLSFITLQPTQITKASRKDYYNWVGGFLSENDRDVSYLQDSTNICHFDGDMQDLNKLQQAYIDLHLTACAVDVNISVLEERRKAPMTIAQNGTAQKEDSEEQFTWATDKQIGFFYNEKGQYVNKQLLNYALIKLKDLMLESANYMNLVYSFSNNPNFKSAIQQAPMPSDI